MSDYCLRFNAAVIEVNDLTAENEQLEKRITEMENDLETLIKYIAQVDTQNALNSLNDRGVYLRDDAKELTAKYGFFDYWKEGGGDEEDRLIKKLLNEPQSLRTAKILIKEIVSLKGGGDE